METTGALGLLPIVSRSIIKWFTLIILLRCGCKMLDTFNPNSFDSRPGDRHCYFNFPATVTCFTFIITKAFRAVYELGF